MFDGSDSESETADLNTWTRSGGPLMRTASADKFVDYVQNLERNSKINQGVVVFPNTMSQAASRDPHYQNLRVTTPERSSDVDSDHRVPGSNSSILVAEGDLLQPERLLNGIMFNIVKKEDLTSPNRSHDLDSVAECVQIDCPDKETDASSTSEYGDDVNANQLDSQDTII